MFCKSQSHRGSMDCSTLRSDLAVFRSLAGFPRGTCKSESLSGKGSLLFSVGVCL